MSAAITIALAGDLMLGRLVGDRIARAGAGAVWGDVLPELRSADLLLANLECALTSRRERWRDGHVKAFYFRASPTAVEALRLAGVDFVALATITSSTFARTECARRSRRSSGRGSRTPAPAMISRRRPVRPD